MRWLFLAIWILAGPVQADRATVLCVQNQLAALGHDPGPIDGILGGQTRRAFSALNTDLGEDAYRFRLTRGSAIVLCRELGAGQIALRQHWPATKSRVNLEFGAAITETTKRAVSVFTNQTLAQFSTVLGMPLADTVSVFVSDDIREIQRYFKRVHGRSGQSAADRAFLRRVCSKDNQVSGFANPDAVVICLPQGDPGFDPYDTRLAGTTRRHSSPKAVVKQDNRNLRTVIFHELVHAAQFQLTGEYGAYQNSQHTVGPEWLVEGAAVVLAEFLEVRFKPPKDLVFRVSKSVGGAQRGLQRFERFPRNEKDIPDLYGQGSLAAVMLVEEKEFAHLLEFYRLIGLDYKWRDAFLQAFDVRIKDFYAAFDGFDSDAAAASLRPPGPTNTPDAATPSPSGAADAPGQSASP